MMKWWSTYRESRQRVRIEDALKHMHECAWRDETASRDSLAGVLRLSPRRVTKLCQLMQDRGLLRIHGSAVFCTPAGERLAIQVIRAHRLWETYLADEARMKLTNVHAVADRREHRRSEEAMEAMEAALGHPVVDPHGDPIPTAEGLIQRAHSVPLNELHAGDRAVVVHLEDEPRAVFSQIIAVGLAPGRHLQVLETSDERIRFTDGQDESVLAPIVAGNVFVARVKSPLPALPVARLSSLKLGTTATVHGLDDVLQGYTRRRMLDLGLTAGASITAEYRSFLGDPTAFRVRGALIALRREQAEAVLIQLNGDEEHAGE